MPSTFVTQFLTSQIQRHSEKRLWKWTRFSSTALDQMPRGNLFEHILARLGESAPIVGQFRTPKQIRAFMVAMIDPDMVDTIFDPACGTGGFLIDCVDHILSKCSEEPYEAPVYGEEWLYRQGFTSVEEAKKCYPNLQTYTKGGGENNLDLEFLGRNLYGIDVSRQMMRMAVMNLRLHGTPRANLRRENALSELGTLTDAANLKTLYKVILSNPPFSGVLPREPLRGHPRTYSRRSGLLFLNAIMNALAPGGRCAVVVPQNVLSDFTRAHRVVRKNLVDSFDLLAVVSLPAGVFIPYTGLRTSVLVFRRPPKDSKPVVKKVWFYEIGSDGYSLHRAVGGSRTELPECNDIPDLLAQWGNYQDSGFETPPGPMDNSLLEVGTEVPKSWWVDVGTLIASDYDLAPERYKPQVMEAAPEEDPTELVREALILGKRVARQLETLLIEVENGGQVIN